MKRLPVVLLYLWLPALISSGPVAQAPTPQPPTTQPPITVAPAPPPGAPLLVMTFNIRYGTAADGENHWFKRRETLFALLREQQADVIGLQEALHHQVEEILAAVPGYAYVGVGRTDGRRAGEYAAILYRTARLQARRSDTFWFSETPGVVRSATWGNTIERICTWAYFEDREGPSFYLYNVHLDHLSQPSREKSVELLRARIAARDPKAPALVTGDFNAGEQNPAVKAMDGFVDTFRAAHPQATEVGTFSGFQAGRTGGDKIDYVFAEPGVEVLDATILRELRDGRYPSDHFPVTARLRLR